MYTYCIHVVYQSILGQYKKSVITKIGVDLLKSSPVFLEGTIFISQKARCLGADAHLLVQENQGRGITVF